MYWKEHNDEYKWFKDFTFCYRSNYSLRLLILIYLTAADQNNRVYIGAHISQGKMQSPFWSANLVWCASRIKQFLQEENIQEKYRVHGIISHSNGLIGADQSTLSFAFRAVVIREQTERALASASTPATREQKGPLPREWNNGSAPCAPCVAATRRQRPRAACSQKSR